MQTTALRIGTRGSPLALAQAEEARRRLMRAHGLPQQAFPIQAFTTSGDRIQDRPLAEFGGKGLFTKEIEDALLDRRVDIAVHSSKDMPAVLPDGLVLSAFLPREDPRDAFLAAGAASLSGLPRAATVGSSSLRRQALILRRRPDLKVVTFRGNVQTRLRKLREGVVDATILANAGLRRLGLEHVATELLPLDEFPPAPGQGAICIESRIGDVAAAAMVSAIDDPPTRHALECERAFLAALDGSCRTPVAGLARVEQGRVVFEALALTPDGQRWHAVASEGHLDEAAEIGRRAGEEVRERAGAGFFDAWR